MLIIAGMGAVFYTDWKLAVQVRSLKAFVEGYVFAEAVAACEKTQSSTPFKWNGGTNTSVVGLNSVKLDKYTVIASYTLLADGDLLRLRSDQAQGQHRQQFPGAGRVLRHDPESVKRFSEKIMLKQKLKRDDDLSQSHRAIVIHGRRRS